MSGGRTGAKRKRGDSSKQDGRQGEPETIQILQQMQANEVGQIQDSSAKHRSGTMKNEDPSLADI